MNNKQNVWNGKSRGGSFGHNFFILLIRKIGIKPAYAFLSLIVIYFIPFAPKASKAIWRYNRRKLGYGRFKSIIKLYQHYYTFGQTIIDKTAIAYGLSHNYKFEFDNYDKFLEFLNQGAVSIIGAHTGCWEIGASFFGDYASKLNIVMYDGEYQKIKDALKASEVRYNIIPVNEGGIESLLRIKQVIDKNEYVCFQGDRFTDARNTNNVNFMGSNALFPKGPFLIASKFKTPVVIYYAMREKGMKYRFEFTTIEGGKTQNEILDTYISSLESIVKRYPQQWFNFFDVWQQE